MPSSTEKWPDREREGVPLDQTRSPRVPGKGLAAMPMALGPGRTRRKGKAAGDEKGGTWSRALGRVAVTRVWLHVHVGNGRRRRRELVTAARAGPGVGDEEGVVVRVGKAPATRREWSRALGRRRRRGGGGRARWEGVGEEEGLVAGTGEGRRRREELVACVGRGAGDEEGLAARVGKGAAMLHRIITIL